MEGFPVLVILMDGLGYFWSIFFKEKNRIFWISYPVFEISKYEGQNRVTGGWCKNGGKSRAASWAIFYIFGVTGGIVFGSFCTSAGFSTLVLTFRNLRDK